MSVTLKGNIGLQETVGSEVVIDEDGIGSATVVYTCHSNEAVSRALTMTSHPEHTWLKRKNIKVTREEGNLSKISATFEGVPPQSNSTGTGGSTGGGGGGGGGGTNQGSTPPRYSMKSSANSEPIETHPRFGTFAGSFATRESAPFKGHVQWATEGDEAGKFIGFVGYNSGNAVIKSLAGVKNFLAPGLIYQETIVYERTGADLPSGGQASLVRVGMIDTPPKVNSFVTLPAGYNWLLIGCDAEQVGFGYRIVKQWKLSGPNGWNKAIYDTVGL